MVFHSQRSSQLIHTDNMRWRLALKNTETWEFQCYETRKFQIELTQKFFIFYKMACCQLDCRIWYEYGHPRREICSLIRSGVTNEFTGQFPTRIVFEGQHWIRWHLTCHPSNVKNHFFYVSWLVSQLTLCHHSAAWASASAWTTSSPKLQGLETCCFF